MLAFLKKMFGFRRGDLPDLPPPEFRDLPPPPDWRIQYFDSLDELDRWARANGIEANDAYVERRFIGGAAPKSKVVGLPRPGLAGDRLFDDTLYKHEVGGHSNGLVHDHGGGGWGVLDSNGKFYPVTTRAELAALQAKLSMQPHDWSGAFAAAAKPNVPLPPGALPGVPLPPSRGGR